MNLELQFRESEEYGKYFPLWTELYKQGSYTALVSIMWDNLLSFYLKIKGHHTALNVAFNPIIDSIIATIKEHTDEQQ